MRAVYYANINNINKGVKIFWHNPFENLSSYLLAVAQSGDCSTAPAPL